MSAGNKLFVGVLLVGVAAGYFCSEKPELLHRYLPGLFPKTASDRMTARKSKPIPGFRRQILPPADWQQPQLAQQKLQAIIGRQVKNADPAEVQNFLKKPENQLTVNDLSILHAQEITKESEETLHNTRQEALDNLQKEIKASEQAGAPLSERARVANQKRAERIAAIQKEFSLPATVEELAKDPEGAKIINAVTSDLEWSDQIANSGETAPSGQVFSTLTLIDKSGKVDLFGSRVERDIATATALEFARSGWSKQDAVDRAIFHVNAWRSGKMNRSFEKLPFWQKRMVCGLKGKGLVEGVFTGNDSAGNVRSLTFSQENAHLPSYRLTEACWQAPYRLHNIYGDIVHNSAAYFAPFQDTLGVQFNSLTRNVGGVCGGLSHYGATTAAANGVPATTAGEPEHCSYVVRVGDKWVPSYSLSWQRGIHWQIFQGNSKYSALHMADKLFSDAEMDRTRTSQSMRNLASTMEKSAPEQADKLYQSAIQTQPINYYAWRDYANFLASNPIGSSQKLVELCDMANNLLVGAYPEMAATLLRSSVFPALQKAQAPDKEALKKVMLDFWRHVNLMGPDAEWDKTFGGRWDVEGLIGSQIKLLGINMEKDPAGTDFMRDMLRAVSDKPAYATVALSWANSLYEKMAPALQSGFLNAMVQGATGGAQATEGEREKMLNSVILAAEKSGDLKSFNAIAKSLPSSYTNPAHPIAAPAPFPGQLVSRGGMILASSTSKYDHPCGHWGVLEPGIGGSFHTDKDNDAWVRVTLPKQAHLTGIVLRTTDNSLYRLNNMVVQVSETGRDNDWHNVAKLGTCKEKLIRVDLGTTQPLAKYVRILRKGGPEFFHLLGIYVYGNPAA